MRTFFRRIHLYLGLVSGLFIVFVSLTGTVLVFEKELEQVWHPERYFVTPGATPLPLSQLAEAVRAYKPKAKINGFKVYADPARTVEVNLAGAGGAGGKGGEKPAGVALADAGRAPADKSQPSEGKPGEAKGKPKGKGDNGPRLYLNPYTAAVIAEVNLRETFFHTVEELHRGLVAGKTGKLVMGINAIIFLFILSTGLILWWPATRKALSQRLQVKWGSSWKRLNHDFHIVLGFYASLFLFIVALTGVGMSFDWVGKGINQLTNTPQERPEPPKSAEPAAGAQPYGADAVLAQARRQVPGAVSYSLQLPKEPTGSIRVAVLNPGAITENATNDVYLDQYSGQKLSEQTYEQRPLGQRIRGLFKPVHTGAIWGWPTKILALILSLLGATFPITGTILWWNRTRKNRKKQAKLQAV